MRSRIAAAILVRSISSFHSATILAHASRSMITAVLEASIAIVNMAVELLDKIGRERLQGFIDEGIPARAFEQLVRSLL